MGKNIKMAYYGLVIVLVLWYVVWIASDPIGASGLGLWISYILGGVAIAGTLISSVLYIKDNPKNSKKMLIMVGALLLICGISYAISGGELNDSYAKHGVETVSQSKRIDMGMYLTVFLGFGAIILAVATEAISLFKN
ncbi:MAG: hypothetical protein ACPGYY_02435 [Bacteroidia bacterium]